MKKQSTVLLFTCFILIGGSFVAEELWANSAYRYFRLYKNSETYKMIHGDETSDKEESEQAEPKHDGWGNLVDEPPPPPPDNNWGNKDTVQDYDYDENSNYENKESW